jgi:hypothetical protein
MALSPINPTQLTPPRVAFIDERSGAISREWYRFFLSLLTATQTNQEEVELAPDATSLIASYDAMLATLAQATETQPEGASTSDLAVVQSDLQALALAPPPKQHLTPRYGSFYDTTTQNASIINTAFAMTFNTVDLSFGVTRGITTSQIFVDRPSVYNIQFSAQLHKTLGGTGSAYIWLKKNGTNVPDSTGHIRVQGNDAETVTSWNYIIQLNAGDYIEMMWEVDDTSVELLAEVATAIHPSIPSVILTVTDNISSMET